MSLYDWMARRPAKPEPEPPPADVPPPPPPEPPAPASRPTPRGTTNPPAAPPPDPYAAPDFLPVGRGEILSAAAGKNLMANAWQTGRSSIIPPADDLRTQLIDRALVTHGLLTPEDLAEIHRVGDEYAKVKPSLENVALRSGLAGDAAVQAYREAKEQLKKRKKEESARRKTERAEAVRHRRVTDVIFLGRGVSGRLHLRLSDPDRLAEFGLPVLHTPADVAVALGLSVKQLRWLAFHTEAATRTHYVKFQVPKRSGGVRTLAAPHATLKRAQHWILEHVVSRFPVTDPAHGFVPGRGILSNAGPHVGKAVVVNLDLADFFPSVIFPRVRAVFEQHGYSGSVATVFALLCTECPRTTATYAGTAYEVAIGPRGLPQGAPTSPGLSNQVARRFDKRLAGLAAKLGLAYTRYADDLTFSGGPEQAEKVGYLLARVRHLAADEGFTVNEKKTRVMRRNTAQTVTGVVVNDKPSVSRETIRRLRAILHRARTGGLDAQNREGRENFRAWLDGMIAFVAMIRPDVGTKLRADYDALG
ncbi:MAG TPA: reverse transcriptase family protein [Urbifossiella sp.]|jgi:retron-type reverse transcriptase|nr:reverse transcriptase family protein [Urbifossiella sp.]